MEQDSAPQPDVQATPEMIAAGGEIIHGMFAEEGQVDRWYSRYAAECVFMAMMEARADGSKGGS